MSLYGNKNILFQLQGTLLSACHERKNQRSHEVFGTKDDIYTSDHCDKAFGRNEKRKETIGERSMTIKKILYIIFGCIGVGEKQNKMADFVIVGILIILIIIGIHSGVKQFIDKMY